MRSKFSYTATAQSYKPENVGYGFKGKKKNIKMRQYFV